ARARAAAETNLANALRARGAAYRAEAIALYRAALARLEGPGLAAQRARARHNLWQAEREKDIPPAP
ncbi:MAG: hypothetical protein KGI51_04590, partial [Rhodospirillales bacterium]|nr:hypothetical protein [Rhodospirillales bacterium]